MWWHQVMTTWWISGTSSRHSFGSRGAIARLGLATEKADTPSTSEEDGLGWVNLGARGSPWRELFFFGSTESTKMVEVCGKAPYLDPPDLARPHIHTQSLHTTPPRGLEDCDQDGSWCLQWVSAAQRSRADSCRADAGCLPIKTSTKFTPDLYHNIYCSKQIGLVHHTRPSRLSRVSKRALSTFHFRVVWIP